MWMLLAAALRLLLQEPLMARGRQPVAALTAMVGAHDFGEASGTEVEHLLVKVLEFIEERAALAARS